MVKESRPGNITLDDVLRLVLPLDTEVLGGDHRGRQANWVAVLTELDQLQSQVQAGDVVILPAALQEMIAESTLAESLPILAELSASALIVFRPISPYVNRLASVNELPVLVVSDKANLRDLHQEIAGLLVDRRQQITERGTQLYRRLTEMSREGQGLAAMTDVMSRLTGKIVVVQDKRLEFMALTSPAGSPIDRGAVQAVLGRPDNLPSALRNRKAAANTQQSHWQQLLPIGEVEMARLISPIISGDRARGYLSVVGAPDELDMLDMVTTEQGAAACAMEMAKAKAVSEAKKALRGDFLEGLLAGRLPEQEIARLAGRLDHDTGRPHGIMVLAWRSGKAPSMRRLETALHMVLDGHSRPALTHVFSNDHIIVFQGLEDGDVDLSATFGLAGRVRDHVRAEFPKARLLCGLGGPAKTLEEWPEVYRQALQAMRLGERLQLDKAVEFNSLGIYQLLAELEESPAAQRFCDSVIGPLVAYDRSHRSSLVQTISAYFENHGNISQTAEGLYIHRNTLLYRLERIQELTGQDLNRADMRLALQLALKLFQLRPGELRE